MKVAQGWSVAHYIDLVESTAVATDDYIKTGRHLMCLVEKDKIAAAAASVEYYSRMRDQQ